MRRPLTPDHELTLLALRSLEIPSSDTRRRQGYLFEDVQRNTAIDGLQRHPIGKARLKRALRELRDHFSHAQGPPVGTDNPKAEPAVQRRKLLGKAPRYTLSERGRGIADELLAAELQRQHRTGHVERQPQMTAPAPTVNDR